MNFRLGLICLAFGVAAFVVGLGLSLEQLNHPKREVQPLVLPAHWTPRQAWGLLSNIKVEGSMTVPFKGKNFECVVFSDSSIQYGNPRAVLQFCFDRPTLARFVKEDGLDKEGPAG